MCVLNRGAQSSQVGGKILEGKDLQHGKDLPGSPVLSGGTSAGRLQWVSLAPHWALNYS